MERAIFAGGCFWCTEAYFLRLDGVNSVSPGYIGGNIENPTYEMICTGNTGHAEAVEIFYNPEIVSFETLVLIFFTSHDPTTLNRQGNDIGTQYRSAIFYNSQDQQTTIHKVINRLNKESVFNDKIVTEILSIQNFYKAEEEHMNFYNRNNEHPYCQAIISPKIKKLIAKREDYLK